MNLSFSGSAKAEICRNIPPKQCCALAECFGILLYCNSFSTDEIRIVTESREFAYILPKLFKRAFDISFDSFPSLVSPGKLVFQIDDPVKIEGIMAAFGFHPNDTLALHVNLPVVEEDCCKNAFLRGAFLAGVVADIWNVEWAFIMLGVFSVVSVITYIISRKIDEKRKAAKLAA